MVEKQQYYVGREPITEYADNLSKQSVLERNHRTFTMTFDYLNNSSQKVHVVNRQGMKITLPPSPGGGNGTLLVRINIAVGSNVNLNIEDLLLSNNAHDRLLAEIIDSTYDERTSHRGHYHVAEAVINLGDVTKKGGNVFYHNLDIVVSTLNLQYVSHHPATQAAHRQSLITSDEAVNDPERFGYSLFIVDPKRRYGKRFVNINNQVHCVPVKLEPSLPDGVYCVTSGSVEGDVDYAIPQTHCYSFEEADEKLSLYTSVEEARTYGDVFAQRERELKELTMSVKEKDQRLKQEKLEHDQQLEREKLEIEQRRVEYETQQRNEQLEHENRLKREKEQRERESEQFKFDIERRRSEEKQLQEQEKQARERKAEEFKLEMERERNVEERRRKQELLEHEKRIERLKEEYAVLEHQHKVETLKRKDKYEERTHQRKDTSEVVKFIPAIVTGIFAVAVAVMKFLL